MSSTAAFRDYGKPSENAAFVQTERLNRCYWADIGLALGAILMPAGAILDWFLYPDVFLNLFLGRMFATMLLVVGFVSRRYWSAGRLLSPVSLLLVFIPGAFMCWMMYATNAGQSRYYFGLILLMIIVQMLGFSAIEAMACCASLIAVYLGTLIASAGLSIFGSDVAIEGLFFLAVSSAACVTVCYTYRKNRFEAFCLNQDLIEKERQRRESILRLRDTEQQLVHSEKMRAIAGVAAGLLHEINNPVNYSLMAIKVLKKKLAKGNDPEEIIADIEEGVTRISHIVTDLRSFAHPEQLAVKTDFVLADAIDTAIRFLTHELPDGRVQVDRDSVNVSVCGAQSQIVQVLLNLIHNGERAIRDQLAKGPAGLLAEPSSDRRRQIHVAADCTGDRVFITVSDDGIGMSEDQIEQATQPYFTTHEGEGLGLGLGICDTIVQAHGGAIQIDSTPGVGTAVRFDLPAAGKSNKPSATFRSEIQSAAAIEPTPSSSGS
ncbi:HAMP domain-containing histidine kinase [Stieleria sp. JC731]|uniref:sensor histidine kinase n=1 Tax=Pirellulaceae TaxID=2691357 RepID=UPI001E2DC7EA|nr:HAMP domain-containing sensor histidine kinase [Stieleria sp. JC731]MCC9603658.1 HAMP domain-containing histidine kinase [Stieleria sp. JC731]